VNSIQAHIPVLVKPLMIWPRRMFGGTLRSSTLTRPMFPPKTYFSSK